MDLWSALPEMEAPVSTEKEPIQVSAAPEREITGNGQGQGVLPVSRELAPPAPTPLDLLRIAVSQQADLDKLTKLMDLQERWEANEARKAFNAAMKQFKANPPTISKNKRVHYAMKSGGSVDYRHATLDHVCDEVIPALSAVGITHRWRVAQDKDLITVICVLTHEMGHSEETQLMGMPDTSGDKSPLKAVSSTVTHLERYTLLAGCGLAPRNEDDETENNGGDGKPVVEVPELEKNLGEISRAKNIPELKFLFTCASDKAREIGDQKAFEHYVAAKDKRYRELQNGTR